MKIRKIRLDRLRTLRRNAQYLTPEKLDALKRSIERFGLVELLIVREIEGGRYEILSGNHRYLACRELGLKSIYCVVIDLDDDRCMELVFLLNVHGELESALLALLLLKVKNKGILPDYLIRRIRSEIKTIANAIKKREIPRAWKIKSR